MIFDSLVLNMLMSTVVLIAACDDRFYGDCLSQCYCREGICHKTTGKCINNQCSEGWMGNTCSQECHTGRHGYNCGSTCDTCNNTRCNKFNGTCIDGCNDGYTGDLCDFKVIQHVDGSSSPVAAIVGGIAALIVLICLAVVAVMYRIRRKPKNTNHQNYEDTQFTAKSVENLYSNTDDGEEYSEIYINEDWVTNTDSIPMSVMPNKYGKVEHVTRNKALPVNSKNVAHKIQVKDLQNIINEKRKNNGAGFEDEFKRISEGAIRPDTEGTKEENKAKIGCMSAVPYEHARVILRGDTTSDYINACFIGSYYDDKAYIATQAPMANTIKDFWHMVWQENVDVIVMMTKLQDDGMSNCEQYWPASLTKPLTVGSYKVYLVQEKRDTNHVYRMMKIFSKMEKIEKAVNHFQFTHWPNNGIPDIIKLIGFYRKVKRTKTNGPVIVLCSTGVGRTGTFIALDVLYENGVKTGHVDPIGYITMMRKAQMNMVQTKEQYAAILEALLEIFTVPDTSVDRDSFCKYAEKDSHSLRREFQKLVELKPSYRDDFFRVGKTKDNASKNVFTNILPHDQFRPLLETFEKSRNDYINAVVIPRYKESGEYIVTQYPLKHTVVDFWTMVYDKGCTIVVLLETVTATVPLWPKFGDIIDFEKINLRRNEDSSLFTLKNVVINNKNSNETRTVSVISMDEWNRNDVPTSIKYMLNLLSSVSSWTEQHPGSIAVVCQDGCRRSGVFVALSLIFEKMDIDDDIDIFQVMRTIQIRRPEFISTFNQYEYCYKCIKEYLDDSM